jgi:tetratricopeptide (TPR) repeat protein
MPNALRIGLLGPFPVRDETGRPVYVGGRQLRILLTLLALNAGRVVPGAGRRPRRRGRAGPAGRSAWRGQPLADAAGSDFADAAAAKLTELRSSVLVDRIEADLALGEGASLVGELRVLLTADPLAERPRALLMRALYAAGRQAEALVSYHEGRVLLADQLGVDPSAQLEQVYLGILRGPRDPPPDSERADAGAQAPASAVRMHSPLTSFVGRDEDVSRVLKNLRAAHLVTLTGPGGVGKTRLATEASGRLGVAAWFVPLAPVTDPADVASALLDTAAAALAGRVLAACPRMRILATSRQPLRIDGETLCPVPPLTVPPGPAAPVAVDPDGSGTRFRMLETVRAYGLERLAEAGEEAAALTAAGPSWDTDMGPELASAVADLENWSSGAVVTHPVAAMGEPMLAVSERDPGRALAVFERYASSPDPWLPAAVPLTRGTFGSMLGRLDSGEADCRTALAAFRKLGEAFGTAVTLVQLAEFAKLRADYPAAIAALEEAGEFGRALGAWGDLSHISGKLAFVRLRMGDFAAARADLERAEEDESQRDIGLGDAAAWLGQVRAELHWREGDADATVRQCADLLGWLKGKQSGWWDGMVAVIQARLALAVLADGDEVRCRALLADALQVAAGWVERPALADVDEGSLDAPAARDALRTASRRPRPGAFANPANAI